MSIEENSPWHGPWSEFIPDEQYLMIMCGNNPSERRKMALEIYNAVCNTRSQVLGDTLDAIEQVLERHDP